VQAFHAGRLGYLGIVDTIAAVVDAHDAGEVSLPGILEAERWARHTADRMIAGG
jgi:1-deoxy-D-xylulose-5-phosphate reductoisomerase